MRVEDTTSDGLARQLLAQAEERERQRAQDEAARQEEEAAFARQRLAERLPTALWKMLGIAPATAIPAAELTRRPVQPYVATGAMHVNGATLATTATWYGDVVKVKIAGHEAALGRDDGEARVHTAIGDALRAALADIEEERQREQMRTVAELGNKIRAWPMHTIWTTPAGRPVRRRDIEAADLSAEEKSKLGAARRARILEWRAALNEQRAWRRILLTELRETAVGIHTAAQEYVAAAAAYDQACAGWAEEWTDRLWEPAELWEVVYAPMTPLPQFTYPEEVMVTETVVCFEAPEDLFTAGTVPFRVTKVTRDGQVVENFYIGALLHAVRRTPEARSVTEPQLFYRSYYAGRYVVNVPAYESRVPAPAPDGFVPPFYEIVNSLLPENRRRSWGQWIVDRDVADIARMTADEIAESFASYLKK